MLDLGSIAKMTKDVVKELTNLVGLIEKNLASYDRIAARFRRKRIAARLQEILLRLTEWRASNIETLWRLAEYAIHNDNVSLDRTFKYDNYANYPLLAFLEALLSTRDLIDEFKKDIVHVDYRLYEELQDAINGRIEILRMLLTDPGESVPSIEKIKSAYVSYSALVESIGGLKDKLQSASQDVSKIKPIARESVPKAEQLPKAKKARQLPKPKKAKRLPNTKKPKLPPKAEASKEDA
jgi:hypothetical protein